MRRMGAHMIGAGVVSITWQTVVQHMLMQSQGNVFGHADHDLATLSTPLAVPSIAVPVLNVGESTAHAVPRASATHMHVCCPVPQAQSPVEDSCFRVEEPCKLCTLLGRNNARTHEWAACYANPLSLHCCIK